MENKVLMLSGEVQYPDSLHGACTVTTDCGTELISYMDDNTMVVGGDYEREDGELLQVWREVSDEDTEMYLLSIDDDYPNSIFE